MSVLDKIREFMDTLGDDGEIVELDPEVTEPEPESDENPEETAEADELAHDDGESDSDPMGVEDSASSELDDLRAQILAQAATIETMRNTIAELGGGSADTDNIDDDAEVDDTPDEAETIAAFDADYDKQKAMLAELTKES